MRRLTSVSGSTTSRFILVAQHHDHRQTSAETSHPGARARNQRSLILRIRAASLAILLTAFTALAVTGCTTEGFTPPGGTLDPENPGTVMGGLQPVTNSSLQVYAVDISGSSVVVRTLIDKPTYTNSAGNFSIYGKFTCPDAASQIYLVATGGNPGLATGKNNPNINLLSALGACGDITATTPIVINEVTTVAGVAALSPYLNLTNHNAPYLHSTQAELQSAFHLATNFANAATGTAPGTGIPAGYTVPSATINTLANLLSTCVYTSGGTAGDGTPCGKLFSYATEPGTAAPSATLNALLNILDNPTRNVDQIYNLVTPAAAPVLPFTPQLSAPPANWSIDLVGEASTPVITAAKAPGEVIVSLSDAYPTAAIHYTVDGSIPSASSSSYTGPFTLTNSATVRAIAVVGTDTSSVATEAFTIAPAASTLVFLTQPKSTLTTDVFSASVALEDAQGNIVPTATEPVTLALGSNPSGATLQGTLTATPVNGIATFSMLSLPIAADAYTLVAQATGLPLTASRPFDITLPYPNLPSTQAHSAASFVQSVGINVHFNYYGSIYTNNTPLMIRSLQKLGITHLRDAMCWQGPETWNTYYTLHQQLGSLGFKTDFIAAINQPTAQVTAFPALVGDAEAVEPANEYDISGDLNWVADITAQQKSLYKTIRNSPYASSITVLAPSLAFPWNAPLLGNMSSAANAGNLHGYFGGYNPGNSFNNPASYLTQMQIESGTQPVWVTETGYFAQPGPFAGSFGVDLATQAIYVPRTLLEYFNAGAARTYLYELADDLESGQNPYNYHWGLLDSNGNPKPSFNAVANLLSTLADPNPAVAPSSLAFNLKGADSSVHHTLFQKSDGTFYLAVWLEDASYNFLTQQAIAMPSRKVNLQLNVALASAQSIQFDATGAATTTPLTLSQSIPVTVTDKLQILKLTPR